MNPTQKPNLYILTGGPGAGKTTILAELARRGHRTIPEIARQLIREQVQSGGSALPWSDRERYASLMLQRSIESFRNHNSSNITFCDRGIPDTLCYLRLMGFDDHKALAASMTYRYAQMVFFAPPWEEIYAIDTERKQDFAEAIRTAELMASVYRECGYKVIGLPLSSPKDRADFILRQTSPLNTQS